MISELNRARLEWMIAATRGDLFPKDLFPEVDKYGNGWDAAVREAVQAALNEIDELNRRLNHGLQDRTQDHRVP